MRAKEMTFGSVRIRSVPGEPSSLNARNPSSRRAGGI
jgi:hypothetical protein